jgi:hypothetical protein
MPSRKGEWRACLPQPVLAVVAVGADASAGIPPQREAIPLAVLGAGLLRESGEVAAVEAEGDVVGDAGAGDLGEVGGVESEQE